MGLDSSGVGRVAGYQRVCCGTVSPNRGATCSQLAVNLLSISRTSLNGAKSTFFFNNGGVHIEESGHLLSYASSIQDLYWIAIGVPVDFAGLHSHDAMMWHRRFGHVGFNASARIVTPSQLQTGITLVFDLSYYVISMVMLCNVSCCILFCSVTLHMLYVSRTLSLFTCVHGILPCTSKLMK